MIVGTGDPEAVTANAPDWPRLKKALEPVVKAGAAAVVTVIVSDSVAVLPDVLVAEIVTG